MIEPKDLLEMHSPMPKLPSSEFADSKEAGSMLRYGTAPFLECSSKGDKRFSAFYAKVDGKSIEDIYQAAKRFKDGSTGLTWREAKGKKAINMLYCSRLYANLWDQYIKENPELLQVLQAATGLSDVFGREGSNCQATELWRIRNTYKLKDGKVILRKAKL